MSNKNEAFAMLAALVESSEETPENCISVGRLFRAVRKREQAVMAILFQSKTLRPLLLPDRLGDGFLIALIECVKTNIPIARFRSIWGLHRPRESDAFSEKQQALLRETFDVLHVRKEQSLRQLLNQLEVSEEAKGLLDEDERLVDIFQSNLIREISEIVTQPLDDGSFEVLAFYCDSMLKHGKETTIDPMIVEIVLANETKLRKKWPIDPYHHVTHKQIRDLAGFWGIDPAREPNVLWILRQALEMKLPSDWEILLVEGEDPLYKNLSNQKEQDEHPAQVQFLALLAHARKQDSQLRDSGFLNADLDESKAWMKFELPYAVKQKDGLRDASITYYYNFNRERAVGNTPLEEEDGFVLREDSAIAICNSFSIRQQVDKGVFSTSKRKVEPKFLELLTFNSWWTDEFGRRNLELLFHVDSGNAQVSISGTGKTFTMSHLQDKASRKLEAFDLFIGAQVVILGRRTTLMQASAKTVAWNEKKSKCLGKMRENLEQELKKYTQKQPILRFCTPKQRGAANLYALVQDIRNLHAALKEFRPKVADQIVSPLSRTLQIKLAN